MQGGRRSRKPHWRLREDKREALCSSWRRNARAKELAGKLKASDDRLTLLEADLRTGKTRLDEERKKVAGLAKQAGEKEITLKGARAELLRKEEAAQGAAGGHPGGRDKLRAERERAERLEKAIALTRAEKEKVDAL